MTRPATEPAARLVERDRDAAAVGAGVRMPRPAATAMGALLVLLRVLAGVAWLAALAATWRQALEDELGEFAPEIDAATADAVLWFVLGAGAIILLVEAVLAVLIFLGANWPRILVMVFATLSISGTFAAWWAGDQELTLDLTLVTLALDILVMLALSSRPARAYARRPREPRRRGRRPPGPGR
ncbi:hypothetical protein GE115_07955 [Agromyces sp. CFH 90414]|uniref:Uncharacterized protein n=1 Tax=Agromyces agglutinans TaxID=2662258 RepID=A0A6I2FAP9_9MICO|nr:hypothetical protein [Agromyces agglutinans]MRG59800.1 hypothetical protein [Agromyces agglutinans]